MTVVQFKREPADDEGARRASEESAGSVRPKSPDPEVAEIAKRRRFSAKYKLRILREADACKNPGEIGALLRREGLYSSNLAYWRRQRDSRTTRAGVASGRFAGMRLVGEGTVRRITQPQGPDQTTRLGRVNLSGQWDKTASDWSLGYRLDNSRTRVLDRQIIFVGDGQGDYNENGDYLGPGLGDHDLVTAATTEIPADADAVLLLSPERPLPAPALAALRAYLERGGRLVVFLEPGGESGLDALLADWGITSPDALVIDPASNSVAITWAPISSIFEVATNRIDVANRPRVRRVAIVRSEGVIE